MVSSKHQSIKTSKHQTSKSIHQNKNTVWVYYYFIHFLFIRSYCCYVVTFAMDSKSFIMRSQSYTSAAIAEIIAAGKQYESDEILEILRLKAKKFFVTSIFGFVYTNTLLVLSVLSCFQYIVQTYFEGNDKQDEVTSAHCIFNKL